MANINSLNNEIFNYLKDYVEKNNTYGAIVTRKQIDVKYPIVVFQCNSNVKGSSSKDEYGLEKTRMLSFEISIIAVDKTDIGVPSEVICDELENLVTEVMDFKFHLDGGTDAKLLNINDSHASQYILHYSCEWFMRKNIIY